MRRAGRRPRRRAPGPVAGLAVVLVACLGVPGGPACAAAQQVPASPVSPGTGAPGTEAAGTEAALEPPPQASPWYLERGTSPRPAGTGDPVPPIVPLLVPLLRDGSVPGFYDGQFAATSGRFGELAALVRDPDVNHVLRVMAVMALQEAGQGEALAAVLDPYVLPAGLEFQIEHGALVSLGRSDDPDWVAEQQLADLSRHARYALAKSGQPRRILEKIAEMDRYVSRQMDKLLDPAVDSEVDLGALVGRELIFDIGYHYQQFDDYGHAVEWYRKLTDHLPGKRETRWAHYNLACIAALRGRPEEAVAELEQAWAVGFSDVAWLLEDGDLASLRERPDFRQLVERMRHRVPEPEQPQDAAGAAPGMDGPGERAARPDPLPRVPR